MPGQGRSAADPSIAALDDPAALRLWLQGLGVRDADRGIKDLRALVERATAPGATEALIHHLGVMLPACPDPAMALSNLERFVDAAADGPLVVGEFAAHPKTLEIVVQLFSTSQYFSDLLVQDPPALWWLRGGGAARRDRGALVEELRGLVRSEATDAGVRLAIRRFRRREMLRIGYGDIVRGLPLEVTTLDLSDLADACLEAAAQVALDNARARHGEPIRFDGEGRARFVVLALGKLGGQELNYSSDIDLIFLYDEEGRTDGPRPLSNSEFFAKVGSEVARLLADHTGLGVAYRVDLRLRPEGEVGPLARSIESTLGYYETSGRTWERQALIKCRPAAGDLGLGAEFLDAISPFVFKRYLSAAEIAEIQAMKRRIEARTRAEGAEASEVKTGRGGIRDVEFVVQFLQLLHGGADQSVRHANTIEGLSRLEGAGCLASGERDIMESTYRFLRTVEHRLQTMFDRQTHRMPDEAESLRTLAIRMGFLPEAEAEDRAAPARRFLADYRAKTDLNRRILNHLLHDAFAGEAGGPVDPVIDLILDPNPSRDSIDEALRPYAFADRQAAYGNLMELAREDSEFLSQARCRHFLAAIAPRLLSALSRSPDPDLALTTLEKVSASLGAKAILWELFSQNPPSLRLYVDLCAHSPMLSEMMIKSPGMIDDLMDSLVVDRPRSASSIRAEAAELCRGAEDLAPILSGFRNGEWVRIGARDILAREPARDVMRELSDVAQAILGEVARHQWGQAAEKLGTPRRAADGRRARWAIVGLGKLGGREMTYHSDLDLVFVYESDGQTSGGVCGPVPNDQFFAEVARRVLKALGGSADGHALYRADARLRPHGASGPLAVPLDAWRAYFRDRAQTWERLAMTRARVVYGQVRFGREVAAAVREALTRPIDPASLTASVLGMRRRLQESRASGDLKRGAGGQVDVEFIVQYLQLRHASSRPDVLRPNVWEALDALASNGVLPADLAGELLDLYDNLRTIECRVRIARNHGGTDVFDDPVALARLARRLGYDQAEEPAAVAAFRADLARYSGRVRDLFARIVSDAGPDADAPLPPRAQP